MLKIELLGPFSVYRGEHLITAEEWRTAKNKDLLKILLKEPGRDFSQDELLERLWPGGDPEGCLIDVQEFLSRFEEGQRPSPSITDAMISWSVSWASDPPRRRRPFNWRENWMERSSERPR